MFLFGGIFAILLASTYVEEVYGGPIHGKGICPASPWPSYNAPDVAGNTGLPCSCAPIYKWYLEPKGSTPEPPRPARIGNYKTVGGCVWTAEDLEKDPTTWDHGKGELLYWEKQRLSSGE